MQQMLNKILRRMICNSMNSQKRFKTNKLNLSKSSLLQLRKTMLLLKKNLTKRMKKMKSQKFLSYK